MLGANERACKKIESDRELLESVGYTEREAAFLYLVAVHSGYFLRRQYSHFIQREPLSATARTAICSSIVIPS
jgi:hypothetical protein